MIFVTVGSQTPFDRLVLAMDNWAKCQNHQLEIIAQIGTGQYLPSAMKWVRTLSPDEFKDHFRRAQLIVSHAGMGTVLTALEFGKPLLLLARRADLHETRNDHQRATARWLSERPGIHIAINELALPSLLDNALHSSNRMAPQPPNAPPALVNALRNFIDQ